MSDGLLTEPSLDLGSLRQAIQEEYAAITRDPGQGYHFHTGRPLANMLGYHDDWLEGIPEGSIASFAGTGNPFRVGLLTPGTRIVDIPCNLH
jgi:arsenite methyltransferase